MDDRLLTDEEIKDTLYKIQPEGFSWDDPTPSGMIKFRAIVKAQRGLTISIKDAECQARVEKAEGIGFDNALNLIMRADNNTLSQRLKSKINELAKEAGWKSPEEVELMYNPDYLNFEAGAVAGKTLLISELEPYAEVHIDLRNKLKTIRDNLEQDKVEKSGYVQLAEDQSLPNVGFTVAISGNNPYWEAQQDMLKQGWKRVVDNESPV